MKSTPQEGAFSLMLQNARAFLLGYEPVFELPSAVPSTFSHPLSAPSFMDRVKTWWPFGKELTPDKVTSTTRFNKNWKSRDLIQTWFIKRFGAADGNKYAAALLPPHDVDQPAGWIWILPLQDVIDRFATNNMDEKTAKSVYRHIHPEVGATNATGAQGAGEPLLHIEKPHGSLCNVSVCLVLTAVCIGMAIFGFVEMERFHDRDLVASYVFFGLAILFIVIAVVFFSIAVILSCGRKSKAE